MSTAEDKFTDLDDAREFSYLMGCFPNPPARERPLPSEQNDDDLFRAMKRLESRCTALQKEINSFKSTDYPLICRVYDLEEDLAALCKRVAKTGVAVAQRKSLVNRGRQQKGDSKKRPGHPEPQPKPEKPSAKGNTGGQLDPTWLPQPVSSNGGYRHLYFSPAHTSMEDTLFQPEFLDYGCDNFSQSRRRVAVSGDFVPPKVRDKACNGESEDSDAIDSGYCLISKATFDN
ncbi:uncharacterized protein F5Z01DRAFT_671562 [Emericellopsis atlantica]|uniref:Uncharacterized protein n=1 Tax=Emericellopsis atlantica TaxID=2614577 RepID=A0A9P8CSE2_9HYPO|nr:uncharacterized protein F5Z01DRAFT_671562 [Emericellopsis atlantica]KAG9257115.1 hypothetical protein F5Z01DRAFT_671562 [Emericellopsis atlantica]